MSIVKSERKISLPQVDNRAVRTAVVEHLRRLITLGELQPGERLLQEELATEMGVSRMPVRDAINDLQQEGLVVPLPRGGVAVAPINASDVESIYGLRLALDRYAVVQAVKNARDEHFDKLDACVNRYEAVASEADVEVMLKLDREFHSIIYEMTGNGFIEASVAPIWAQAQRLNHVLLRPDYLGHVWDQHRAMAKFLRARDAESVLRMMEEHLNDAFVHFVNSRASLSSAPSS